jgi:hypothetical protein
VIAARFHGDQYRDRVATFELTTSLDAGLGTADPGVVHLDLPMQRLTGDIDHARRSLCSIIHAVSYRRSPSCRWRPSAEIPRVSVVIKYAAQNQWVSGVFVLCKIVPAVRET